MNEAKHIGFRIERLRSKLRGVPYHLYGAECMRFMAIELDEQIVMGVMIEMENVKSDYTSDVLKRLS